MPTSRYAEVKVVVHDQETAVQKARDHFDEYFRGAPYEIFYVKAEAVRTLGGYLVHWEVTVEADASDPPDAYTETYEADGYQASDPYGPTEGFSRDRDGPEVGFPEVQ